MGVFQLESGGMRDLLKKMRPSEFEDLIAINGFIPSRAPWVQACWMILLNASAANRKFPIRIPNLEGVLKPTYGIILYQEQVMQIASVIAGFNMTQADDLRKAMGKKIAAEMQKMRSFFHRRVR